MGKWVPRLDIRGAYPIFHTPYAKIARVLRQRKPTFLEILLYC